MADIFADTGFGDFGTDWWDVPADYFTGGMDFSGGLDPSLYSLSDPGYGTGSLDWLGDSGFGSTGGFGGDLGLNTQWLDTLTGQVMTLAQVRQIDPSFTPPANGFSLTGQPQPNGGGGLDPSQYSLPPANDPWWGSLDAKTVIGALTAAGGLGAVGLGIGSLFGGNDAANRTSTQTSAAGQGPRSPEAMQLLGSGGGGPGLPGAAGGGGTGLLGLSNMMIQNLMGSGQGGALGGAPGLGQPAPGAQIGQISEMPGGLQTRGPGNIGYAGGTPNFNESTGMYAPGTGPLWAQAGGGQVPPGGRDPNVAFAPAVRQWNEAIGQYGYNPGYGPSPGGGAMALPQGQPQNWPAMPGSGGGYLSAPSSGQGTTHKTMPWEPVNTGFSGGGMPNLEGWSIPSIGGGPQQGGGQTQPFQLGAPPQLPGYPPAQQGGGQGGPDPPWRSGGVGTREPQYNPYTGASLSAPSGGLQEGTGWNRVQYDPFTGASLAGQFGTGQAQPRNWPAVPGSGGGYLSAPSGGGQAYGGQPQQASGQQAQVGQGLIGQQSNILGGLQSQIPQLNPAILQALGMQAQGMAQGYLPSLSDPQAQARIQSIYQPGFDALNYSSGLALSNAREQLQQRGFQAPDIREGPTQALTAPILAAQQLGRSQLYGQMAGAQLDLASRLPMLGSQLNAQNYSTQAQPFNLGTQLAGAYNQPIQTQGQFPLSLLDILERGRGSTSTVNTVGPQPSLTQSLGQVAPIVGAGGGLLSSAGNALFPQSQNPYGVPRYDPFTGRSLSGV